MRRRRYVWMMVGRLVLFLAAVVLPLPAPVMLVLIAGAVLLPWVAVQTANVGPIPERSRRRHSPRPAGSAALPVSGTIVHDELGGSR